MAQIYQDEIKRAIEYGKRLESLGEQKLARDLYVKCVRYVSSYRNTDILQLFYGRTVYDKIQSASDAVNFIYAATVAERFYDLIAAKNPADSGVSAWAECAAHTDSAGARFLEWLSRTGRTPSAGDAAYFQEMYLAVRDGGLKVKMCDGVRGMRPEYIFKELTAGTVKISGGELR